MLAIIPVGSVVSCVELSGAQDDIVTVAEPEKQIDSLSGYAFVRSTEPLERVDLFVYPDKEPRVLLEHIIMKERPFVAEIRTRADEGDLLVLAAGNLADEPGAQGIARYETAEKYKIKYSDYHKETRFLPLSGTGMTNPGEDMTINMESLCAEITIQSIVNLTGGYNLIEKPGFHLENASSGTELFRMTGFYPVEFVASWDTLATDCDVGMFTQYPELVLHCLPDESGSTILVMDCEIKGQKCCFRKDIGPIARGEAKTVEYEIRSPSDWSCTMSSAPRR